jgi:hypothetical protein
MSLRNLLYILRVLGPLVLWWDGGGRGERFIQLVKPFIKRGVRGDALNFFATLLGKMFRVRIIDIFEKRYELESRPPMEPEEESTLGEILEDIAEILLATTEEDKNVEEEERDEEEEEQGEEEEEEKAPRFSHSEIHGMTKTKAFYIYRNELQLNKSLQLGKPISGIIVLKELEGKTAFEFQLFTGNRRSSSLGKNSSSTTGQELIFTECGVLLWRWSQRTKKRILHLLMRRNFTVLQSYRQ